MSIWWPVAISIAAAIVVGLVLRFGEVSPGGFGRAISTVFLGLAAIVVAWAVWTAAALL